MDFKGSKTKVRTKHVKEISVVIPFKLTQYLMESLTSLIQGTVYPKEIILVGNASNLYLPTQIFSKLENLGIDLHIEDSGDSNLPISLNQGIKAAKHEFIARLDADDINLPKRFELQHKTLMNNPRVAVVGGQINLIDSKSKKKVYEKGRNYPTDINALSKAFETGCPIAHPSVMMRKGVFELVGGYDSRFNAAEDLDLWLRILRQGWSIINLGEDLINYRIHSEQNSNLRLITQEFTSIALLLNSEKLYSKRESFLVSLHSKSGSKKLVRRLLKSQTNRVEARMHFRALAYASRKNNNYHSAIYYYSKYVITYKRKFWLRNM